MLIYKKNEERRMKKQIPRRPNVKAAGLWVLKDKAICSEEERSREGRV